jgi:hypothetical protein
MDDSVCRCGHSHEMHLHHRPGTDCSACTGSLQCARFQAQRPAFGPLVAQLPTFPQAALVS